MSKAWLIITGGILVILAAGIAQFLFQRIAASPAPATLEPSPAENNSTTTPGVKEVSVSIPTRAVQKVPSIAKGDSIASWTFKGAYADNPELIAKAQVEIKRLSDLLSTATSSAMILSVDIANQYELLGDGKKQYEYLERAARTNPENGLPWHNLGVLMERLGAYETARIAYEKSTLVQSELKFYHYAYIEFLTSRTKDDVVSIEKAFAFAEKNIGKTQYLIDLRAEWEKS